jgi:hypothetical protein
MRWLMISAGLFLFIFIMLPVIDCGPIKVAEKVCKPYGYCDTNYYQTLITNLTSPCSREGRAYTVSLAVFLLACSVAVGYLADQLYMRFRDI